MTAPAVRYARSGEVSIAYQLFGEGPFELVVVPGFVSNVEASWDQPEFRSFLARLASFARVVFFDKRGTGLSDRVRGVPTLEERMDDLRAVMDAAGLARPVIMGISEGGPMTILFAATYPERISGAILYGAHPRTAWAPDFPWGETPEALQDEVERTLRSWGTREFASEAIRWFAPSRAADSAFMDWWARYLRAGASPGAAVALARMNYEIDVRHVLPAIRVPTLVLNREGDEPEPARLMAERIPGARYLELPGADHAPFVGDAESVLQAIEEFLPATAGAVGQERVLSTVLFTDVVGSTERAVSRGDAAWAQLLRRHHEVVERQLALFRGRLVDTAGDGVFASFDGPVRAIRCAGTIRDLLRETSLPVRAGLHTGECEIVGDKLAGLAVHLGARIAAAAAPGEILVSRTVKDLVAGSGIAFEDRGPHTLKGIPEAWHLYAVQSLG